MVNALLDTSIIVDLIRGYGPAQEWYLQQTDLGVSRAVWLEILEGAPNRQSQQNAINLLRSFELEEITAEDMTLATEMLLRFNLSHNIDAFDCIIAALNTRLEIPLYTRNLKHFVPLLGELAQAPY